MVLTGENPNTILYPSKSGNRPPRPRSVACLACRLLVAPLVRKMMAEYNYVASLVMHCSCRCPYPMFLPLMTLGHEHAPHQNQGEDEARGPHPTLVSWRERQELRATSLSRGDGMQKDQGKTQHDALRSQPVVTPNRRNNTNTPQNCSRFKILHTRQNL
jgi:hypothetical protein